MCTKTIQKNRQKAFIHQNGCCFYCDSPMWLNDNEKFARKYRLTLPQTNRFKCTAEHLKPKAEGGRNTSDNIVAACAFCNHTRHRMIHPLKPTKYKKHIKKRILKGKWHQVALT